MYCLTLGLTELFFVPDPTAGEQRTGDYWFQLPIACVRFHYQLRNTLYEPDFTDGGPAEDQFGSLRWTVFVKSPDRPKNDGMTYCNWWREEDQKTDQYEVGLDVGHSWIGYTIFEPAPLENFTEEPEQETFDVTARKPKALTSPLEPTQQERELHNLTHLPYRSWCEICVKAKGKETHPEETWTDNRSSKLSMRSGVLLVEHADPGRGANGLEGVKGNIRGYPEVFFRFWSGVYRSYLGVKWANLLWKCRSHFWTRPCQRPLACRKVARRRYRQARRRRFSCRLTCRHLFLLGWLYCVKLCYSLVCIVWNKFCRILDRDPQPCRGLNTMLRGGAAGGSSATKRKRNEKAIQNDALTRLCNLLEGFVGTSPQKNLQKKK